MTGDAPPRQRLLVLGGAGMLGHTLLRWFCREPAQFEVTGTFRNPPPQVLVASLQGRARLITGVDATDTHRLRTLFHDVKPDLVVNCIGVVKQLAAAEDPLIAIPINALLPHQLAALARECGAQLIHISTDCVFSGRKGHYIEDDTPDPVDVYGRTKWLGEVAAEDGLTLRTSCIGPELGAGKGLLSWLTAQQGQGPARGFNRAVFSGLPTVEIARVIQHLAVAHRGLRGVFHLGAAPIDKYSLLTLIAREYLLDVKIEAHDQPSIDRSLDASRFCSATGYTPPDWPELIRRMRDFG